MNSEVERLRLSKELLAALMLKEEKNKSKRLRLLLKRGLLAELEEKGRLENYQTLTSEILSGLQISNRQIRSVGVNINQLVRLLNSSSDLNSRIDFAQGKNLLEICSRINERLSALQDLYSKLNKKSVLL